MNKNNFLKMFILFSILLLITSCVKNKTYNINYISSYGDLSNVINLTDFQKNIVSDYFQGITDLEITNMFIQGSVLNEKAMDDWYKTGLVLRIDEVIKTETGFEFTVFKIRDGYETVIVSNCEVKYVEGETVLSYIDEVIITFSELYV